MRTNQPRFKWITPCGLNGVKMVSLQEITGQTIDSTQVRDREAFHFGEIYNVQLNPIEGKDLQALLTAQVANQPSAIGCFESAIRNR